MTTTHQTNSSDSLDVDHAVEAIIGRRAEQQDSARCVDVLIGGRRSLLLIVADGMGGAVGGRLASTVAVAAFESRFRDDASLGVQARLQSALDAANNAIGKEIKRDRALESMGCTLIAVVTDGRDANWISVGDSLLLVHRNGHLDRLNDDHSMAAVLDRAAARGEISQEEAESSPQRSMLRSALTGAAVAMTDRGSAQLSPNARLIVASDGILTLSFDRIARLSGQSSSAASLVSAILDAVRADMPQDQDNLTVAVAVTADRRSVKRSNAPMWAKITLGVGVATFLGAAVALALIGHPGKGSAPREAQAHPDLEPPVLGTTSATVGPRTNRQQVIDPALLPSAAPAPPRPGPGPVPKAHGAPAPPTPNAAPVSEPPHSTETKPPAEGVLAKTAPKSIDDLLPGPPSYSKAAGASPTPKTPGSPPH